MILLVSDIGELKANPKRSASGTVLEAEARQGPRSGRDGARAGRHAERRRHVHRRPDRRPRARAHRRPRPADEVGGTVDAGRSARPRRACRSRATSSRSPTRPRRGRSPTFREEQAKTRALGAKGGRLTLESLQAQIAEGGMKELPIIIKADVQGSAEVLADTLAEADRREGEDPDHPRRRRRGQRVGRAAGVGVERDHHRVQRAARPQRRGHRRRASASTSASTRSSTTSPTR